MTLCKDSRRILSPVQLIALSKRGQSRRVRRFKPPCPSQDQEKKLAPVSFSDNFRDLCSQTRKAADQKAQNSTTAPKGSAQREKKIPPLALGGHLGLVRENQIPMAPNIGGWRCYANTTNKGGPVKESGGRVGKLDAANESGYFHKMNKSRLEKLKKILEQQAALKNESEQKDK